MVAMSEPMPPAPAPLPRDLARRLAGGDERAVDELFDACADALHHFAYRYVGVADEAWDVVQDAFLRLWRRRTELDPGTDLRAYLFTITRNRALDVLRRRRLEDRVLRTQIAPDDADTAPNGDREAAAEEITAVLRRTVEALPPRQREIVLLRWHERLTYDAIGQRLGISSRTVEAHMHRALERLRQTVPGQLGGD